jgi:hypothetical protein
VTFDPNAVVGVAGTLIAVPLGAWMNARATARAEAKAERDALGIQFDAMLLAATGLRAAVEEDRMLWSSWQEKMRAAALAAMTGAGAASLTKGSDRRQLAAALGGASWFLAQERTQQKTATSTITLKLAAVANAAAPLLRHSDTGVREATDRFMTAAFAYHETRVAGAFETAAANFGNSVRAVLYPTSRRRLFRSRREQ